MMKKLLVFGALATIIFACSVSVKKTGKLNAYVIPAGTYEDTLRFLYSLPADQWPEPFIDSGIVWKELGIIPESPLQAKKDSLRHLIELGKILFFDPRLSGSNQISCASCHIPDLSWADGRSKSVGHDQKLNKRNSPSLLNVWGYERLFWDGRSPSLEDQAFGPINSESEMHSEMSDLMRKLRRIPGYKPLFDSAFHGEGITPETLTSALAVFQRTLVSRKADFDDFLLGKKAAMSDAAIRGLHLFRTKARCMNCHFGPLFTDNAFHNIGLTYYKRENEDLGRYAVTHLPEDVGRFKTPSLRDVIRTRPWMHNGLFDNIDGILNMYSAGMPQPKPKAGQEDDPLFPKTDKLLRKLDLTSGEKQDIIAFLNAITAEPLRIKAPAMPQ
jgi:cytochrome c peroxidase